MTQLQQNVTNWFENNKSLKLAIQQIDGIIEAFEGGTTNKLISEMKIEVNSWVGIDFRDFEIRTLDALINQ